MNLLDSQSNYGLLHTDFSPKPAFTQLKNLLAMIGSSAPAQVTPVGFRIAGDTTDARALVLQQATGATRSCCGAPRASGTASPSGA